MSVSSACSWCSAEEASGLASRMPSTRSSPRWWYWASGRIEGGGVGPGALLLGQAPVDGGLVGLAWSPWFVPALYW